MRFRARAAVAAIGVSFWAAGVGAQAPSSPGASPAAPERSSQSRKWWQSEKVKAELGLSAQQSQDVETVFQASLPRLRELKRDLDRQEGVLSRLVEENVDEAQVAQQVDRVEATRAEMSKVRTLMLFRMHKVLSAEQRAKLKAIHERSSHGRDRDRSHGRPGPTTR
jgi:Spy/CpxP family protein refolding chaperone